MKKFIITEEEKNRILGMHKVATSKHYLMENDDDNMDSDDDYGDTLHRDHNEKRNGRVYLDLCSVYPGIEREVEGILNDPKWGKYNLTKEDLLPKGFGPQRIYYVNKEDPDSSCQEHGVSLIDILMAIRGLLEDKGAFYGDVNQLIDIDPRKEYSIQKILKLEVGEKCDWEGNTILFYRNELSKTPVNSLSQFDSDELEEIKNKVLRLSSVGFFEDYEARNYLLTVAGGDRDLYRSLVDWLRKNDVDTSLL